MRGSWSDPICTDGENRGYRRLGAGGDREFVFKGTQLQSGKMTTLWRPAVVMGAGPCECTRRPQHCALKMLKMVPSLLRVFWHGLKKIQAGVVGK